MRLIGCWVCLWLISGCGGETGPKCYPIHGTVNFDKMPVPEGMIIFHPLEVAASGFPNPVGYTDMSGNFTVTTFHPNDGAPAGRYALTVEYREPQLDGDEVVHDGPNLLPEKYADPATSKLECVVHEGDNEVPAIELKRDAATAQE